MSDLIQFESNDIRRIWDDETEQWYFAVVDVVGVLSEATKPNRYWGDMKRRDESGQLFANCVQFKLKAKDGKMRATDCADIEGLFRIIQSIPSPKAEPFRLWLARLGRERIEEGTDPAIAIDRLRKMYKAMGHKDEWVKRRVLAIQVNDDLIGEWESRGVTNKSDHDLLMDVISQGTFEITTAEHRAIKGLSKDDDLPDNMTTTELVFKMLGESSAAHIADDNDVHGLDETMDAAERGGKVAGRARRDLELESGKPVVSSKNALESGESTDEIED